MDRADENWYFYLNEEEGWRLRVLDAAAGSRYYVMDHTKDGGASFQKVELPWDQVTDIPDDVAGYGYLFLPEETGTGLKVTAAKDSSGQSMHLIFSSEDQGRTWNYEGAEEG